MCSGWQQVEGAQKYESEPKQACQWFSGAWSSSLARCTCPSEHDGLISYICLVFLFVPDTHRTNQVTSPENTVELFGGQLNEIWWSLNLVK